MYARFLEVFWHIANINRLYTYCLCNLLECGDFCLFCLPPCPKPILLEMSHLAHFFQDFFFPEEASPLNKQPMFFVFSFHPNFLSEYSSDCMIQLPICASFSSIYNLQWWKEYRAKDEGLLFGYVSMGKLISHFYALVSSSMKWK